MDYQVKEIPFPFGLSSRYGKTTACMLICNMKFILGGIQWMFQHDNVAKIFWEYMNAAEKPISSNSG